MNKEILERSITESLINQHGYLKFYFNWLFLQDVTYPTGLEGLYGAVEIKANNYKPDPAVFIVDWDASGDWKINKVNVEYSCKLNALQLIELIFIAKRRSTFVKPKKAYEILQNLGLIVYKNEYKNVYKVNITSEGLKFVRNFFSDTFITALDSAEKALESFKYDLKYKAPKENATHKELDDLASYFDKKLEDTRTAIGIPYADVKIKGVWYNTKFVTNDYEFIIYQYMGSQYNKLVDQFEKLDKTKLKWWI